MKHLKKRLYKTILFMLFILAAFIYSVIIVNEYNELIYYSDKIFGVGTYLLTEMNDGGETIEISQVILYDWNYKCHQLYHLSLLVSFILFTSMIIYIIEISILYKNIQKIYDKVFERLFN